jgi:hypothetical protein
MNLILPQQQFVLDIGRLIFKAADLDVGLTLGEALRTADQQLLYYYGLTIRPDKQHLMFHRSTRKTRTVLSRHMQRLAIDFNFIINGEVKYIHARIEELGYFWEKLSEDNRWGGNFTNFYDAGHFEKNVGQI